SANNCATGHNLVVTDVLDSNLTNINVTGLSSTQGDPANPATVCVGNSAGTTDFDLSSTVSAQTVSVNASCLDPGKTISITIQAQLVSSLPAGYTLPNTGNLTYTSLPGTNGTASNPTGSTAPGAPGDATGERIGTTGVNNYTSSASAPLTLSAPSIVKQAPASTGVAVGSEVTYPILVTLPEGLTRAVRVVDAVPAGMQFVRAEMANISTGMLLTNNPPLVSPAAPVNGDDVTLDFGDVTTPVDPAANTFTVNVTLQLLDVSANQIGAVLINSASLIYKPGLGAGDTTLPGGSQSITVVEPRIVTVKTVNPTRGVNAGDTLTYTARFTNTGDSIAYDVSALDALAQGTHSGFIAVTSCKDQAGTDVSTSVTPGSGTLLFDGPWDIAVGGFVECVYTAVVQPAVHLDGTHTNLIDADWYSGDDASGRFYDDTPRTVDTDLDDDDAVFSTGAATLTKTVDTTTPTIGQAVTYTLTLNAPLGTLRLAQIVDTLQAGLRYVPGSQTITSGTISAPAFSETVGMLTWDFGDAVISAVPVVIQYQAVVENIDPNQDGQIRDNNVVLNYLDAQENPKNVTDTRVVTLIEPGLQIVKDIIAIPAAPDAGDLVTYRLTISHNPVSTANAYDLVVVDTLPASLDLQEGSITVTPNTGVTNNSSDALNQLNLDVAALPLGATLVVEYQAQLVVSLTPGSTLDNTANLSWTSMPGANVDERQGLIEDLLNNYLTFDGASFGSSSYTLTKYLVAPVDAAPVVGETVTYALNVGLPEGLSANVNVADALPAGLSYLSYSVETSGYGLTQPFNGSIDPAPAVTAPGGSGGDFAVLFALVQPAADNNPDNNNFVVLVNAVVVNETANQDGTVLDNSATLQVATGPIVSAGPVDVTVTEPVLTIDKTAPAAVVNPGQTLTYTLTLDNPAATSTADAFDVVLTDTLPAGLTASNINAPAGWTSNYNAATGVITLQGDLPLGQQAVFTYDVTVGASVTVGSNLTNTVAVTWTSLAGAIAGERTGADGPGGTLNDYAVQDSLTINYTGVDLSIAKTDGGVTAVPGGQVTYQLSLANLGNLDATNVVLTESLPTYTTLVGPAGWTCAGSSFTYAFGALAAGATSTVDFIFQVNATLPASVEQLSNTVSITSTELDPHPDNNTSGDTTPLDAAPQLTVTKTDSLSIVGPDSTLTYLITVTNTGNQNATGIVLTDTLPGVVSFVSATGSPALAGGVLTWPAFDLAAGANRTFNVTVKVAAEPSLSYVENLVAVTDDGSNTGGTPVTDSDTDRDEIADTQVKTFQSTSHADTGGNQVAIGERITYVITLDVPPGTMNDLTATDVMMRGLAFDGCVSIDAGSLTTNLTNGFSDACADPTNPVVSAEPAGSAAAADQGRRVVFTFGDVTNAGEVPVTLTVTYEAAVLNVAENINGRDDLANVVSWAWDGGGLSGSATPAEVVEPELALDKTAANPIVPVGQVATFTLTVAHTPESTAAAYNVVIQDRLPVGLTYVPGSLRIVSGPAGGVANDSGAPLLTVTWPVFGLTDTAEVTYQAIFLSEKNSTNAAAAYWTSLPIDPSNPYNQEGGYRGYVPGDSVNDYVAESSVRIREPEELPNTGFAPGVVTTLPAQPADKGYQQLDGITLEIPALGLSMPVVGVPLTADGWDLTWLDDQAGYLAGTAFPGVVGTTGITGHATTPDGKAGPFIHLGRLKWGDVIIVHAGGYRYQYEVRQNRLIQPDDLSVLSNDGYVWLTLLTCKGFNEKDGSYLQRVAVRAVLLKVTAEQ
ncbi:MAG: sortase, partial [Anaerolineae bacterium]|nr:sortase [Anaerolineae bacterium]